MGIALTITSGKGGTGKSTVATGLAIAFATLKKSVLLIDMDQRLGCLDLFLGIDAKVVFDLGDILSGRDISDGIYDVPSLAGIKLIPAPKTEGIVTKESFKDFIEKMRQEFDVVIIDMPAGVDFSLIKNLADDMKHITVSGPDPVSVRDAYIAQTELSDEKVKPRLIINRFDKSLIKNRTYKNIDDIIDGCGIQLLGIVPISKELALLPINHRLKRNGCAQKALLRITKRLLGENIELPNPKKI